jgi:hypothetical protein
MQKREMKSNRAGLGCAEPQHDAVEKRFFVQQAESCSDIEIEKTISFD